jgi:fructokinase
MTERTPTTVRSGTRPVILGVGELLWDCFPDGRRPGGAPANVAFHATQLGLAGLVISRVGADEPGDALRAYLRTHGLDPASVQIDPARPTGTVTVDMSRPEHPDYTIHDHVAWDHLTHDDALAALAGQAAALCFGSLAQRHDVTRGTIHRLLAGARTALKVFDVNLRQQWYTRAIVEDSLHAAAVVKLNDGEVAVLADLLDLPQAPERFAAAVRERYGPRLVCVTRGANGCALYAAGDIADRPGVAIQTVDAVGAGDAFTAALIAGLLQDWELPRIAGFANQVGALVASRAGAMPELAREYATLRSRAAGLA